MVYVYAYSTRYNIHSYIYYNYIYMIHDTCKYYNKKIYYIYNIIMHTSKDFDWYLWVRQHDRTSKHTVV
jgi:hypothetical protein